MKTSANGIRLVEQEEGLRLHIYDDVVGRPTIGYGHLIQPHEDFNAGITQTIAEKLLIEDLATAEAAVNEHAPNINQNQFDALVDFAYNLGGGSLAVLLSHGIAQVPTQILRWNHAGGKMEPGLTIRRQAELALFQS